MGVPSATNITPKNFFNQGNPGGCWGCYFNAEATTWYQGSLFNG